MKSSSVILTLLYATLMWIPAARAAEKIEESQTVTTQHALANNWASLRAHQENQVFETQMKFLDEADQEGERQINALLDLSDQEEGELKRVLHLSLSENLPPLHDFAETDIEKALRASLLTAKEEDSQQENKRRAERKEEKRRLIQDICALHPQVIALRTSLKDISAKASEASSVYVSLIASEPEIKDKANEESESLHRVRYLIESDLNEAGARLDHMLDRYFVLISNRKPSEKPKRFVESALCELRPQIATLRREAEEKRTQSNEAFNRYRALWNSGSLEEKDTEATWSKQTEQVKAAQLELDNALAEESEMMTAYFTFVRSQ